MPTYDFTCEGCTHPFEELVFGSEEVACPRCHSTRVRREISGFAVATKGKIPSGVIDAARLSAGGGGGACGTCGDPAGPGSCE